MMRRYREAEVKPEVPVMDPVAAADVNPLESARADVPIPDEQLAKAHSPRQRLRKNRPGGFFFPRGKGKAGLALLPVIAAIADKFV